MIKEALENGNGMKHKGVQVRDDKRWGTDLTLEI